MKPKFIRLDLSQNSPAIMELALQAVELLYLNRHTLFDDFLGLNEVNKTSKGFALIAHFAPFFWAITDTKTGELAGVAYLYDVIGMPKKPFSAYVSTCFRRKYWGKFVARAVKKFMRYIFGKLALHKLSAEVYADNLLGCRCVERAGFSPLVYCSEQTIRGGKLCDTRIFTRYKGK